MDYDTIRTELEAAYQHMAMLKDLFTRSDPAVQRKALRVLAAFSLYDKVDQLWNQPEFDVVALKAHVAELVEIVRRCLSEEQR